jgi:hypothetical protein
MDGEEKKCKLVIKVLAHDTNRCHGMGGRERERKKIENDLSNGA